MFINTNVKENCIFETHILCMCKISKRVEKEVFGQWKRKLFNTYMDRLLDSFLLLMKFCGFSLGYGMIVNILCTVFCLCIFLFLSKLKTSVKTLVGLFSTFTVNIRLYLTCSNKENNFKASMISSTSFISLAYSGFYVLLYYLSIV